MFQMLDKIDRRLRARIENVALIAERCGESGIVDWAVRAANDAVALGKLRDKDAATLDRLEGTFSNEFYSNDNSNGGTSVYA